MQHKLLVLPGVNAKQTIYFDASFIRIDREIRNLQCFEYIQNARHGCRHILGIVTS